MSIDRQTNKQNAVYTYSGIVCIELLFSLKKERNSYIMIQYEHTLKTLLSEVANQSPEDKYYCI